MHLESINSLHQGSILEKPEVMLEKTSKKRMAQESRKDFGMCRRVETLVRSIISREGREQAEVTDDGADGLVGRVRTHAHMV